MAATQTRSTSSANGSRARDTVASATRRGRTPLLAAGAAAAGLASGLAIGSRMLPRRRGVRALLAPQRRVLGVPVGPKSGLATTAETLGKTAKQIGSAAGRASVSTDEARQIREQLEKANRRSPLEVVLDGLTHRRGAHRHEG